ncbi:MAG: hypothetical protein Q4F41_06395 [Eubacteriales bacterium]|nr:hypothetical protein [Eubacteriales bacterium]
MKIMDLMLLIRKYTTIFYHKDTNEFDYYPISAIEQKKLSPDARLPYEDTNNFRLPSYEDINHKEIMRFFARECVDDPAFRKQLFNTLRRTEYMDAYLEKLHELNLYEDFEDACGDIYFQIFKEWADKNGLDFWQ